MSKIRELFHNRKWRLAAVGSGCLATAVLILALSAGLGSKAESLLLGGNELDFAVEIIGADPDNGIAGETIYLVQTAEQLQKLGDASAAETAGRKFRLANDITMSLSAPASGAFAGILEGDGHVILLQEVAITVTDEVATAETKAQGLLFGSLESSAVVRNLILDIQDEDASYTRKAKNEAIGQVGAAVYEEVQNPVIADGESVSGLGETQEERTKADQIADLTDSDTINGTVYKTEAKQEVGSVTTTYSEGSSGVDYFGLVCGQNAGRIEQVYVTGDSVTVSREELASTEAASLIQPGYREETYYYKQETDERRQELHATDLSLTTHAYKASESYSESMQNGELVLSISAAQAVKSGSDIVYQVTVTNTGTAAWEDVAITASGTGSWKAGTGPAKQITAGEPFLLSELSASGTANAVQELTFTCPTAGIKDDRLDVDFTLEATDTDQASREVQLEVKAVSTSLYDTALKEQDKSSNGVELIVAAPKEEAQGAALVYTIQVYNQSKTDYHKVTLKASKEGSWKNQTANMQGSGTEFDLGGIAAGSMAEVSFTRLASATAASEQITFSTGGSAVVSGADVIETVPAVYLRNITTDLYDTSAQTKSQNAAGLEWSITADAAVAASGREETITYRINVKNNGDRRYTNLKLAAAQANGISEWKTASEKVIGTLNSGRSEEITLKASASADAAVSFVLSGNSDAGTEAGSYAVLRIPSVNTVFYDAEAESTEATLDAGLRAELTVAQKGLPAKTGQKFEYTLTLTNTNEEPAGAVLSRDIRITTDLNGWAMDRNATTAGGFAVGSNQVIPAGKTVVLTGEKEVSSSISAATESYTETVALTGDRIDRGYRYIRTGEEAGGFVADGEVNKMGAPIASGNSLYAGGIVGRNDSSGIVYNTKQAADLNVTVNEELVAGGIAGRNNSDNGLQHLYLQGKVGTASVYVGEGGAGAQPVDSAASGQEALALAAQGTNSYWAAYTCYDITGSSDTAQTYGDLAWLVINHPFVIGTPVQGVIPLSVAAAQDIRKVDLEYNVRYKARKSMTQASEDLIHISDSLDLGESAFYQLYNTYATDGYYHYWFDSSASSAMSFPYDANGNPYAVSGGFTGNIQRRSSAVGLYDVVVLDIPIREKAYSSSDIVYYTANVPTTSPDAMLPMLPDEETYFETEILRSGAVARAELLFSIPEAKYGITMYADGHIYPMVVTEEFGPSARGALAAPEVTVSDFYDINGMERPYVTLTQGAEYEAGSRVQLKITEDAASYAPGFGYALSQTAPLSEQWEPENTMWPVGLYKLKSGANSGISYENIENEEFSLPQFPSGEYYLYIQAQSKYHTAVEYCYGPIRLQEKGEITGIVYGIEKTAIPEGEEENYQIDTTQIMTGDFLYLTESEDIGAEADRELMMEAMQYIISGRKLTDFAGYSWTEHSSDTPVLLNKDAASSGSLYVYARRYQPAGNASRYGEISEWVYQFAKGSAEVRANPPTIFYDSVENINLDAAATVAHNATIVLYTGAEGTQIFYTQSDDPEKKLIIERQSILPELTDGAYPEGYYVDGSRCYYISDGEQPAGLFDGSVMVDNRTRNETALYLSTVAFESGHNSSTIVNYAYKVGAQQQVAAPESALVTNRIENGKETEGERADISRGATLFFTSMTPNAELYYWIGNKSEGEGTRYEDGVKVITTEPAYVITLVAKDPTGSLLDSEKVTFVYNITDAQLTDAPVATPVTSDAAPAVVTPGDKILLSSPTTGAVIYYALGGKEPVLREDIATGEYELLEGEVYDPAKGIAMPVDQTGFFTIAAVAVKPGLAPSSMVHLTYAYPASVQPPYASVNSGNVNVNTQVELKNRTEGATIYYTVSSGDAAPESPTTQSSVYDDANPFIITEKTTIKAFAVKDRVYSEVVSFTYTPYSVLTLPTASIGSGSMVSAGTILTLQAEEGATVYYTTDGSDPTEAGNTTVIAGNSLILNGSGGSQITVKAYAAKEGKSQSAVATFTYLISHNPGGVTADVEVGSSVSNGSKINLMTDVTGAVIYYTTNGESPVDHGILGSSVTVSGVPGTSFTVKAVAMLNGSPGNVVSFTYRIREIPNTPSAVPAGGVLTVAARVSLDSNVEKIYYTTDGSQPTKSSSLYTEPILINRTTTLKAIAVSDDGEVSEVGSYHYVAAAKASAVEASVEDGSVLMPGDTVALSTDTRNAVIYYSTNGTEPSRDNLDDMLVYSGEEIVIDRSVTIYAVAYREDLRLSDVTSWSYTVDVIPAVEQKKAEEALLAEEGLQDSDTSGLDRNTIEVENGVNKLREKEHHTLISYDAELLPRWLVLETVKEENSAHVIQQVKGLLGEESTVLESYRFKVESGSISVQPTGTVEIAVPIPEGYEEAVLTVASVGDIYNLTTLETRREAGMLYAKTQKFGSYVVIGPERAQDSAMDIPYLLLAVGAAGAALIGGFLYLLKVLWDKWHRRKKLPKRVR